MTSSTVLISLFQYKAWANAELFSALLKLDKNTYFDELHASIRILNHVHVVDQIFKAQLLGLTHSYQGTNTEQTPPIR